jgi:drug/metabolite transporter (DMT)-like permease
VGLSKHTPYRNDDWFAIGIALFHAAFTGAYAVLVNRGTQNIPPLHFAALTALVAAVTMAFFVVAQRAFADFRERRALKPVSMVTLFIIIIPFVLFFLGAQRTSGLNTSMLLLAEVPFTLVFTHFIGERTDRFKIAGGVGIFLGALFVLYNGTLQFNWGDLLIILSTACYPIGNLFTRKALHLLRPASLLFLRSLAGGVFLFASARIVEPDAQPLMLLRDYWPYFLFTGVAMMGVVKLLWHISFQRMDISKAISLVHTFPLFSLVLLLAIFHESISLYQWIGIGMMLVGVFFTLRRPSVNINATKYAAES